MTKVTCDPRGTYRFVAIETSKGSRGALRGPIKADSLRAAVSFAKRTILASLPGWEVGSVTVYGPRKSRHFILRR